MLRSSAGAEDLPLLPAEYPWDIRIARAPESVQAEKKVQNPAPPDPVLLAQLRQRTAYAYPYLSLAAVPTKLAASELSEQGVSREFVAARRPAFFHTRQNTAAEGTDEPALLPLTPSERGTALHTFMQFARYHEAAENPAAEIERLVSLRFLTRSRGSSIPCPSSAAFSPALCTAGCRPRPACFGNSILPFPIPPHPCWGRRYPAGKIWSYRALRTVCLKKTAGW